MPFLPYDPQAIEKKWQTAWLDAKVFAARDESRAKKRYVLDMFPYPSAQGLHVGHPEGYTASDILSRYLRMQGKEVLHPMGFDSFGLPAENYAIKTGTHPAKTTAENIANMRRQIQSLGFSYDWDREVITSDPSYYKWTQWIFLKLFEKGLAYEDEAPINWCPKDKTGLANEEVVGGKCDRCGTPVEKKNIRQWLVKITDERYIERLLNDLDNLDWPESIKQLQRNWIGKSEGMLFTAPVRDTELTIQTFSAHFEAFCADTFVVIAPDHPFLPKLVQGTSQEKEVLAFAATLVQKRAAADIGTELVPEGIFTGRFIVDPVGNGELPIWVANYAVADYGTGIVKCSAHDARDFAFAKKYTIPLKPVLFPVDVKQRKAVERLEVCFTDMRQGILREPKEFAGKTAGDVRKEIIAYLQQKKLAQTTTTYKLRDWVFSRQRYWGEPIPMVHCAKCGIVSVSEKDLPVELPNVEKYEPTGTGESPLAGITDWVNTKCPNCGGAAKRETNTMPQWAGSNWYFLRYCDPHSSKKFADPKKLKAWLPVDVYVGGAEHAVLHLLYARFIYKVLFDIGEIPKECGDEPFVKLKNQGLILGEDGVKMSKSRGNVINPDDVIKEYGADAVRMYEMFMGPFEDAKPWSTQGIRGVTRFLEKVWALKQRVGKEEAASLLPVTHGFLDDFSRGIERFAFNTCVSDAMKWVNAMAALPEVPKQDFVAFLKVLSTFAPHIAEELWHQLGHETFICQEPWPKFDPALAVQETFTLPVQINSKVRVKLDVATQATEGEVQTVVLANATVQKWLAGKEPKQFRYVPGKIVSIVV